MKHMCQYFVRAVAHKHLIQPHAVGLSNGFPQRRGIRIRIQTQCISRLFTYGIYGPRRRAVRMLVGIQLEQIIDFGLLARHIWRKPSDLVAPETAHLSSLSVWVL